VLKAYLVRGPPARHEEPKEQYPAVEGIIADAKELRAGDRVVYPNQGVCRISGLEVKDIAGQKLELVTMTREEDGAAVMVPKGKVPTIGLRKVASAEQIEGVFHYLAASYDDPELDWKVRHRDNADRLIAGGVLGVAEVVKGLHALSRIRPLPTKEREQYDNARHLLVHEVAVSLSVPPALAEDYIDYALMPPEGVKFDLKPPPKPVPLPSRPRRRPTPAPAEEESDDLGLGDLGLDLDLGEALDLGAGATEEAAVPAVAAVAGAGAAEGGEDEEEGGDEEESAAPDEEDEAAEEHPAPKKGAPAKKHAKEPPAAAKKAAAKKPPPKKAAPVKKPAPAKKPAAKAPPAARKAAPAKKTGGKKK
jgi:CarD family transcriptional regulator